MFQDLSVLAMFLIVGVVLFTLMQMILSSAGSSALWPSMGGLLGTFLPSVLFVAASMFYLTPGKPRWEFAGKFLHVLLPTLYAASVGVAFVLTFIDTSRPSHSAWWPVLSCGLAVLFCASMSSLVGYMPPRILGSRSRRLGPLAQAEGPSPQEA